MCEMDFRAQRALCAPRCGHPRSEPVEPESSSSSSVYHVHRTQPLDATLRPPWPLRRTAGLPFPNGNPEG